MVHDSSGVVRRERRTRDARREGGEAMKMGVDGRYSEPSLSSASSSARAREVGLSLIHI